LQAAIAAAHQKAEAAAAQVMSDSGSDSAPETAISPASAQQQQQQELPEYDMAAAAALLQPLKHAEQEVVQRLQQQRGVVQQLKGQLAAARARRKKYAKLQGVGSNSSSSDSRSGMQHVCEQCLQPINVELYAK
jgi:hypothetical protein